MFIILVLHVAQILKNHHGKCSVCCHGFKAYNTQKQLGQWIALIVLVLQATEIKKPTMMNMAFMVVVSKHGTTTEKKD